ncbi:CHAT domain-containing protein [Paraburkholderia fungorum]|uniref:CHAT domain-containing protein n=1 Tax=Paraburkholderia fungorum TaxID=134537 RepID=UPI0038BA83E4
MTLTYTSVMLSIALALALPLRVWPQSNDKPPATASDVAAASQTALSTPLQNPPWSDARVHEIREQLAKTTDGEQRYALLIELSRGYYRSGHIAESLHVRDEIVGDSAISKGRRSLMASELAASFALTYDYARSQRMIDRAKELAQETPEGELESLPREPAYAFLTTEAEIDRRHLNRHDVALLKFREHADLAWSNLNNVSLSERRRRAAANEVLTSVSDLTRVMVQNNRRSEALSYANEMQWYINHRPDLQPTLTQRANVDFARAIALCSFDDYDAALTAINASVAEYQRAGLVEHDVSYGNALRMRLLVALGMGRIQQFAADAEALDRGRAINPVLAGVVSAEEFDSLSLAAHGQWASANEKISVDMARLLRYQGAESPFYKYQSAMQMLYRLDDPAGQISDADIERYVVPLTGTNDDWSDSSTRGSYDEDGALVASVDHLMRAGAPESAQALAFRIAELLHVNATQGAMIDGAARLAAGNPDLRALIEQEQALRYEQNTSRMTFARATNNLANLTGRADTAVLNRQSSIVEDKEKALKEASEKLRKLRHDIAERFPVYRELVAPAIPSPEKIGTVLKPNEVYVNLYAGRNASYAFVVQPGGALQAVRLDVTREQLKKMAVALRASFDAGTPPSRAGDAGGFDLAAASGLYAALIAPIQAPLQGATTIYLSTTGLLAAVPFNVLVTRPAKTLAEADWWITTATPVQMPSASALVLARSARAGTTGTSFIAFADPAFDGRQQSMPASNTAAPEVRARAIPANASVTDFDYHRVAPLPETLDEARAIATALGASPQKVIWGIQASRSHVLKEDMSDDKVVVFATHGVIAGQVPGLRKAGLALAYEGSGLADSILTIDDIVTLRLNADWVVLSACNTGFATGDAGDSLSALSRGFFAAGARSLLVTQWAVESQSAKQLTVGLFQAYAEAPTLSKADSLAHVQRDMLNGKYGALYRHPYFWGAYTLAGNAAR